MPYYRVNGLMVHMKLGGRKKPPAPCIARIAVDGKPARCCGISGFLCDWRLDDGGTCDAPLCAEHAHQVGSDEHLCPHHLAQRQRQQPDLFRVADTDPKR